MLFLNGIPVANFSELCNLEKRNVRTICIFHSWNDGERDKTIEIKDCMTEKNIPCTGYRRKSLSGERTFSATNFVQRSIKRQLLKNLMATDWMYASE